MVTSPHKICYEKQNHLKRTLTHENKQSNSHNKKLFPFYLEVKGKVKEKSCFGTKFA